VITGFNRWLGGVILAQTDKVDEVEGAVESAQVTGWQVLAAVLVLVAAYLVGRLARRLVKRSFRKSDNVPPALVYDVSRGADLAVRGRYRAEPDRSWRELDRVGLDRGSLAGRAHRATPDPEHVRRARTHDASLLRCRRPDRSHGHPPVQPSKSAATAR
jgi:hypothetical protein